MPKQKKVFVYLFLGFSLILVVLPFLVSANEILTRVVERNLLYIWIQEIIVPLEAKMMGAVLIPFGYKFSFSPTNSTIVVNGINMGITWNCLGWQSFLLLLVTFLVGFGNRYRWFSIILAVGIGILGTFWLNILRMIFTVVLAVHMPAVFRFVFHDYLAAITTIIWLFAFWWFVYSFVLDAKSPLADPVSS